MTPADHVGMTTQALRAVSSTPHGRDSTTWFGPLLNQSGFGEEMRGFVGGLRAAGTDVAAQAYGVSERYVASLTSAQLDDWRSALEQPDHPSAVRVFHGPVGAVRRSPDAAYQIARTMFETDGLPESAVPHLNTMDEVWVASTFNVATFRAAGVHVPIRVVPSGVDAHAYRPALAPLPLPGLRETVFLSVFG